MGDNIQPGQQQQQQQLPQALLPPLSSSQQTAVAAPSSSSSQPTDLPPAQDHFPSSPAAASMTNPSAATAAAASQPSTLTHEGLAYLPHHHPPHYPYPLPSSSAAAMEPLPPDPSAPADIPSLLPLNTPIGGEEGGRGGYQPSAFSERAFSEFADPDYQNFLLALDEEGGDAFLFADDEDDADPTYDPNEEEDEERGGGGGGDDADDDDDDDDDDAAGSTSGGSSSSDDDDDDDDDDNQPIPRQEVEMLLAEIDEDAMDFLRGLPTDDNDHQPGEEGGGSSEGQQKMMMTTTTSGGGGGADLIPETPPFGLNEDTWQCLKDTGIRQHERGRLAAQMVKHLQLLVQNAAVITHNAVVGLDHAKGQAALADIQSMVKSIHNQRGKSWGKFGFEPGPTGLGMYRDDGKSSQYLPPKRNKGLAVRFTRSAAQRMEGNSKSLMDIPGIASAEELMNRFSKMTIGKAPEHKRILDGSLPRVPFVKNALDTLWSGRALQVHDITYEKLMEMQAQQPLVLIPSIQDSTMTASLPFDAFTPAENQLLLRGLSIAQIGEWEKIHSAIMTGRTVQEIDWFYTNTSRNAPFVSQRDEMIERLRSALEEAPTAAKPPPHAPEEDALLWAGHQQEGPRWVAIAEQFLPSRLPYDLSNRWKEIEDNPPPTKEYLAQALLWRERQKMTSSRSSGAGKARRRASAPSSSSTLSALEQEKRKYAAAQAKARSQGMSAPALLSIPTPVVDRSGSSGRRGGSGGRGGGGRRQPASSSSGTTKKKRIRPQSTGSIGTTTTTTSTARGGGGRGRGGGGATMRGKSKGGGRGRGRKGGRGEEHFLDNSSAEEEEEEVLAPIDGSQMGFEEMEIDFTMSSLPPASPDHSDARKGHAGGIGAAAASTVTHGGGGGGGGRRKSTTGGGTGRRKGTAAANTTFTSSSSMMMSAPATAEDSLVSFPTFSPGKDATTFSRLSFTASHHRRHAGGGGGFGSPSSSLPPPDDSLGMMMIGGDDFDMDFSLMNSPSTRDRILSSPQAAAARGGIRVTTRRSSPATRTAAVARDSPGLGVGRGNNGRLPAPQELAFHRLSSAGMSTTGGSSSLKTKASSPTKQRQQPLSAPLPPSSIPTTRPPSQGEEDGDYEQEFIPDDDDDDDDDDDEDDDGDDDGVMVGFAPDRHPGDEDTEEEVIASDDDGDDDDDAGAEGGGGYEKGMIPSDDDEEEDEEDDENDKVSGNRSNGGARKAATKMTATSSSSFRRTSPYYQLPPPGGSMNWSSASSSSSGQKKKKGLVNSFSPSLSSKPRRSSSSLSPSSSSAKKRRVSPSKTGRGGAFAASSKVASPSPSKRSRGGTTPSSWKSSKRDQHGRDIYEV